MFINFITDSLPAISLGLEPAESDIMMRPPRSAGENIISLEVWAKILYQATLQIIIVMSIYVVGLNKFNPQTASTLAFYCINIMQILHAINLKSRHSIFKTNIFANKMFNASFAISCVLIALVAIVKPLRVAFGLVSLSLTGWILVLAFSLSIIPLVELAKLVAKKFTKERIA